VAPFDAELFGHWWLEGPTFLEHVLTGLDTSGRAPGPLAATTLTAYLERHPEAPVADPAPSSWGEGGFGEAWTGPATARLWRHMHHTAREVQAAVLRHPRGRRASAFEQSIRELMLLESSDWAFMIARGEMAEYAESRVRAHVHRARRLALIGAAESLPGAIRPEDAAWARAVAERDTFLSELTGPSILDAFDPWPAP
jgi:1,4-alpha-glucan branching enzyme